MMRYVLMFFLIVFVAIAGLRLWMRFTPWKLHPDSAAILSTTRSEPSQKWSEAVTSARRTIRAALAGQNLPGLSVAVGAADTLVWAEGFGWADIDTRAPVTPDTRFRIGTASTALTSAAIGLLLEKNQLKLNEEIQTYVPQFPKKRWPITLRQLLTDASGLPAVSEDDGPLSRQRCEHPLDALSQFAGEPLAFQPGTQHRFSNYGWILLSAAVESAAKQPFLPFLRETIFQPLGMENTGAESATEENPERIGEEAEDPPMFTAIHYLILRPLGVSSAKPKPETEPSTYYLKGFGNHPVLRYGLHQMLPRNLSCFAGSMAFFSTPSDLVRFQMAMDRGTLLKPSTVQALRESRQLPVGGGQKHVYESELLGRKVGSWISDREDGIVVVLLSNGSYADTQGLALKVADAFAQVK